ncbi:MAG: hypothetical protein MI864_08180 [Pseudomonadales bacterium]|nr:hypothetical protein [Pseudomonadales bacterium]
MQFNHFIVKASHPMWVYIMIMIQEGDLSVAKRGFTGGDVEKILFIGDQPHTQEVFSGYLASVTSTEHLPPP